MPSEWLIKAGWGLSWCDALVVTVWTIPGQDQMNPDSKRNKVLWNHHAASIPSRKSLSQLKLVLNYNQYPERLFNSNYMSSSAGITTEDYADRLCNLALEKWPQATQWTFSQLSGCGGHNCPLNHSSWGQPAPDQCKSLSFCHTAQEAALPLRSALPSPNSGPSD